MWTSASRTAASWRGSQQEGDIRTVDVSRASGYSTQQIRDLERLAVIPAAHHAGSGYRQYTASHVHALHAYRALARALGPVKARQTLAELQRADVRATAVAFSTAHAELVQERNELLAAQTALRNVAAEQLTTDTDSSPDSMSISELSRALGVPASTLRHWENEQLLQPNRVTTLRARQYRPSTVRDARIVHALRRGGYRIAEIRDVLDALHRLGDPTQAEHLLTDRLEHLESRMVDLLEAGTQLHLAASHGSTDQNSRPQSTRANQLSADRRF